MSAEIEKMKANFQAEKQRYYALFEESQELAKKLEASRRVVLAKQFDLAVMENNIEIAEIAELGEWRPPTIDEYWKRAISFKLTNAGASDASRMFSQESFSKAGFDAYNMNLKTGKWKFRLKDFDSKTVDQQEMQRNLAVGLKAFVSLYEPSEPELSRYFSDTARAFNIGRIFSDGIDLSFFVYLDPNGQDGIFHSPRLFKDKYFFGEDYIDRIAKDVMRKRAEVLNIPFRSSIEATETYRRPGM